MSARNARNLERLTGACVAVALLLPRAATADGVIVPFPMPGPRPAPMTPPAVRYHRVSVEVRGRVATTSIDQVFVNPNPVPMEGEYIFPLPETAAISRFTLDIDGRTVEGELLDADKARRIYEDIVRRQRDPALLEYAGRDMFRARIFPIAPRGERRITLRYEEQVPKTGTLFSYRYPLNTEKFSSRPIDDVSVVVRIAGPNPVRSVSCPSHSGEAKVKRNADGSAEVTLSQRNARPDKDMVVYYGLGGDLSVDVVAHRKEGRDGWFMLAVSPPSDRRQARPIPKDVVFVVDTSGSMAGPKMEQAKAAVKYCVSSLNDADRFNVVRFSTEAEPFRAGLVEASRQSRAAALAFVDETFRARGGTAIEDALALAVESSSRSRSGATADRPLMIAFLTDGRPTVGERDPDALVGRVGKSLAGARVFVFGVGEDLNTRLLDRLAEVGRGSRTYVAPDEDVEEAVTAFYDRVASPVLTDVRLEFDEGLEVRDVYPRVLGDLFMGDEVVVYGRYRGRFGTHGVTLSGKTAEGARNHSFDAGFPGEEPDNAFIARLWATRKIGFLLDEIRLHGQSDELKKEVVALAREFGILTPYTSWLVVEDEEKGGGPRVPMPAAAPAGRGGADAPAEIMSGKRSEGAGAVGASRETGRMRDKGLSDADASSGVAEEARSQVKRLEDKTFYLRDGVWWDSAVKPDAKRTTVACMSDEYFALARKHPSLGKYFALGERVIVALGGGVYEVVPAAR